MMTLDKFYAQFSAEDVEWFKGYREDWQTDDQWLCHLFLQRLFKGFHHIPNTPKAHGRGIELNFKPSYMATFDNDMLTRIVIMSHNWGVRAEIGGSGPAMIKLRLWKRHSRDGDVCERHPTIEEALESYGDL